MNELIKIKTNEDGKQLVSARELYEGLGYKLSLGNFTHWIEKQLKDVDAIESVDFTRFVFKNEGNNANVTDYIITTDTAKEICMVVGVASWIAVDNPEIYDVLNNEYNNLLANLSQIPETVNEHTNGIARIGGWYW